MITYKKKHNKKGFTVAETLIYSTLLSGLLVTSLYTSSTLIESSNELETIVDIEENAGFIVDKLEWELSGLEDTNSENDPNFNLVDVDPDTDSTGIVNYPDGSFTNEDGLVMYLDHVMKVKNDNTFSYFCPMDIDLDNNRIKYDYNDDEVVLDVGSIKGKEDNNKGNEKEENTKEINIKIGGEKFEFRGTNPKNGIIIFEKDNKRVKFKPTAIRPDGTKINPYYTKDSSDLSQSKDYTCSEISNGSKITFRDKRSIDSKDGKMHMPDGLVIPLTESRDSEFIYEDGTKFDRRDYILINPDGTEEDKTIDNTLEITKDTNKFSLESEEVSISNFNKEDTVHGKEGFFSITDDNKNSKRLRSYKFKVYKKY